MNAIDPSSDETFDPDELDAAVNEQPAEEEAPEINQTTKNLTTWDEPPSAAGGEVAKIPPDDEATIGAELVDEGADIADSEQRIASADPDSEG